MALVSFATSSELQVVNVLLSGVGIEPKLPIPLDCIFNDSEPLLSEHVVHCLPFICRAVPVDRFSPLIIVSATMACQSDHIAMWPNINSQNVSFINDRDDPLVVFHRGHACSNVHVPWC